MGALAVMQLAGRDQDAPDPAGRVNERVDFGRATAA
jgi:hypothetical protein